MAKVSLTKLGLKVNQEIKNVSFNEQIIEVKEYLPFRDKVILIESIINQSVDENGFYNPMRVKLYMYLEIVFTYTNINFTEKMKEDPFKLYDMLTSSGLMTAIMNSLDEMELKEIQDNVWSIIKNIYDYKNSAMGILEMVTSDYNNMNLDATNIQTALADPDNMKLLKDVMTKLG